MRAPCQCTGHVSHRTSEPSPNDIYRTIHLFMSVEIELSRTEQYGTLRENSLNLYEKFYSLPIFNQQYNKLNMI